MVCCRLGYKFKWLFDVDRCSIVEFCLVYCLGCVLFDGLCGLLVWTYCVVDLFRFVDLRLMGAVCGIVVVTLGLCFCISI